MAAPQLTAQIPSQMPSQLTPQISVPPSATAFDPARLADIQLPQAIGLWPPAPGWWFLLVLVIVLLITLIYFINRTPPEKKATVKQLKSQTMIELQAIKEDYKAHLDSIECVHKSVQDLSVLLRRYALSIYNRSEVASLTDQQWLQLLDKTYNTHSNSASEKQSELLFEKKYAELLTQTPYQPDTEFIDQALLNECFNSAEILISNSALLFQQDPPHV